MKRKSKFLIGFLSVVLLIVVIGLLGALWYGSFPGKIKAPHFEAVTEGVKTTFHQGVIYRHPGIIPMLEVAGNHYEMGLQYGVLLRPEIIESLKLYKQIIQWTAEEPGVPAFLLTVVAKYKAHQMAKRLPERYLKEIEGIAKGSGVATDSILTISLFYDIGESIGCTGVLMRGKDGKIIAFSIHKPENGSVTEI